MSRHNNYESTALFALPALTGDNPPQPGLLKYGRPLLFDEVRKQGVDVGIVRGTASLDTIEGIAFAVRTPEYKSDNEVVLHDLGDVALYDVGVVRTIIKPVAVDSFVPVLNPTALREHSRNKDQAIDDILRPADAYSRRSKLVLPGELLSDAFDHIGARSFVAKPNLGRMSKGIVVGDKTIIESKIQQAELPYLIEEKIDFSAAMPGVRGVDDEQQARLDEANRLGVNKELRMYYFGNDTWDSVLRVAAEGETDFAGDKWLYIDQDSVSNEVYLKSAAVIAKMKERIGTDEANIALDFVYGSTESNPDPHWEVMEMNVAEPQLVFEHQHAEIGRRQYKKLATQIARIAVS